MNRLICVVVLLSLFLCQMTLGDFESPKKIHHKTVGKIANIQPVDINKALAVEFTALKGIGAKKAAAIIEYRNQHGAFKSIDELAYVKGIGKKGLMRIQNNNPGKLVVNNAAKVG